MGWTPTLSGHNFDGIADFDATFQTQFVGPVKVSKVGPSQDVILFGTVATRPPDGSSALVQSAVVASVASAGVTSASATLPNPVTPGNFLVVEFLFENSSGTFPSVQAVAGVSTDTFFQIMPLSWPANQVVNVGYGPITDAQTGAVFTCHSVSGPATTGTVKPTFTTTPGSITTDGANVTWFCQSGPTSLSPVVTGASGGVYGYWDRAVIGASAPNSVTVLYEGPTSPSVFTNYVLSISEYKAGYAPTKVGQVLSYSTDPGPVSVSVGNPIPSQYVHLVVLTHAYYSVTTANIVQPISSSLLSSAWYVANEPSIGLTDRSGYLYTGQGTQHSGNLQARQRGNWTYTLEVDASDTYEPTLFSPVFFYDQTPTGFILVFAGLIQSYKDRQIARDGYRYVDVTAVSLESIFDTVYVSTPKQYVNQTPEYILTDLFNSFESGSQVTLGTIGVSGVTLPLFNAQKGDKLSDLFTQLATTALFTWNVNPQNQTLFFGAPTAVAAPFPIGSPQAMWDSISHETDGSDYRNRQAVRLSFDAFPHSMEYFTGAGQKSFTLLRSVKQVVAAYITLSTPNTATGAFSGQPSAGDTVTIGPSAGAWQAGHVYSLSGVIVVNGFVQKVTTAGTSGGSQPAFSTVTGATTTDNTVIWTCQGPSGLSTGTAVFTFETVIDNTQFGQVLIGANVAATAQNLADAINANAATRGSTFSLPTWENSQCNAISITGTGFTLQQKAAGTGWTAALSSTGSAFTWSAPQTSGGTSPQGSVGPNEPATISIQVYAQGTSTAAPGLSYTEGSAVVNLATPLNSGTNLNVEYTREDGDVIEVENTSLVTALAVTTHGTGKYQQITDATSQGLIATSALAGLQLAQQALSSYDVPPQVIEIEILKPGILPGQQLSIALTGYWSLLNTVLSPPTNVWYVEEVRVEFVPLSGATGSPWMDQSQAPGAGHYRYQVKLINVGQIGSYLDWWLGQGGGSSGASGPLAATSGGAQSTAASQTGLGSPLTTKGDLWGYDTTNDRVPVGTDGQILTSRSSAALGVDWETPSFPSGNQSKNTVYAGPYSGSAALPTFRLLLLNDYPFHSESLTDGNSNFIFAAGDIVTVTGVPN